MVMNMVGTPENTVTPSASISRMASAGSKTSMTTWVEPTRQLAAVPPHAAEDVKVRHGDEVAVTRGPLVKRGVHAALVVDVAVREEAPLGLPGGSRRVE